MGSVGKMLFGIGNNPTTPEPEPLPKQSDQEPEAEAARNAELRKIKARRSMSGTLLSNPLDGSASSTTSGINPQGLLGRPGA